MSAVTKFNDTINSVYDLDYLGGNFLPRGGGVLDEFIDNYQNVSTLETVTGQIPDASYRKSYAGYAEAMSKWRHSNEARPFWEMVEKARAGKVVERVAPRASFEPIQEWEGYVVSINDSHFVGRLLDLTRNKSIESEEAEFSHEDVSEDDFSLIEIGAIFRWSIGYEKKVTGVRQKVSSIVFRRLPIWTAKEIEAAKLKAKSVFEQIKWA